MIKWNMTPRCTSIVDRNETRIVQAMSHGIWQSDLIFFFTTWTVWTPPVTTWFNQLYIYPPKILVFGVEQSAWGPRIVTGFSRCQGPTCTTFQDVLELCWYPFIAQQFHKLMKGVFSTTSLFRASIGPFFQAFRKTTNPTRKKKPLPPR